MQYVGLLRHHVSLYKCKSVTNYAEGYQARVLQMIQVAPVFNVLCTVSYRITSHISRFVELCYVMLCYVQSCYVQ
jgi:hypothetical protein